MDDTVVAGAIGAVTVGTDLVHVAREADAGINEVRKAGEDSPTPIRRL